MENVFGLAYNNQSAAVFKHFLGEIYRLGFSVNFDILNAADYGVPQNRQRLFIVGARDGRNVVLPTPTHWGEHERRSKPKWADHALPHVTTREAFRGLKTTPESTEKVNGRYGPSCLTYPQGTTTFFTRQNAVIRDLCSSGGLATGPFC